MTDEQKSLAVLFSELEDEKRLSGAGAEREAHLRSLLHQECAVVRTFDRPPAITIEATSCACGGGWAYVARPTTLGKDPNSGGSLMIMLGCVCHTEVRIIPLPTGGEGTLWDVLVRKASVY